MLSCRPFAFRRLDRWLRVALLSTLLAVSVAPLTALAQEATPMPTPTDPFYIPPAALPAEAGVLLRSEPFARKVPAGAVAWRILYTTTRADGIAAVASAIVVAPANAAAPLPVVAWTHGTTGIVSRCAPSILDEPFTSGALPALDQVIASGWALVATDYVGLGTDAPHPYLIGEPAARSALDAVRAARQLDGVELGDQTVVWGHSQGGHAALWTGMIAPSYASDVPLSGVAALAPATDLNALLQAAVGSPFGRVVSAFVATAYSETYDDVVLADLLNPDVAPLAGVIAGLCLTEADLPTLIGTAMQIPGSIFAGDPTAGAFGTRLTSNTPAAPIDVPLLIAQGTTDDVVLIDIQNAWVASRCEAGQVLEYRTYAGRDHTGVVAPDSPLIADLLAWTTDRFAGATIEGGCITVEN